MEYNRHLSYRPTKFPLYSLAKRLEFSIEHSYDPATVMVDTVFYVLITLFQVLAELPKVKLLSPDMRAAEKDLKNYISDFHYLQDNGIHSLSDLEGNIAGLETQIAELEASRQKISNPLLAAVLELMSERFEWKGTATELLQSLTAIDANLHLNPNTLVRRLNTETATLERTHGIRFCHEREGNNKLLSLRVMYDMFDKYDIQDTA